MISYPDLQTSWISLMSQVTQATQLLMAMFDIQYTNTCENGISAIIMIIKMWQLMVEIQEILGVILRL